MLFYLGRQRALDADVQASPGALANFYVTGTTTRQDTYTNATFTIPHANPVVADDYGFFPPIYLDPALTYKVVITDRDGAALPDGTIDPVVQAAFSQAQIGALLYPRTVAESDALVTPTNYAIPSHDAVGYINPLRYGSNATPGTTDMTAAINAAINVAKQLPQGGTIQLPLGDLKFTGTIALDDDRLHLRGAGMWATRLIFAPTANDTAIELGTTSALKSQGSLSDLCLYSNDSTYTKIAIDCIDISGWDIRNIVIQGSIASGGATYWSGGGSVGIRTRGREVTSLGPLYIFADKPIQFSDNPSNSIDIDHFHFRDCYLVGTDSFPIVTADTGINLSGVTFDGYQAWAKGTHGLYWVDTTSALAGIRLKLANVRWEQGSSASHHLVHIEHNTGLQGLVIDNCYGGLDRSGFYLRKVEEASLQNSAYVGSTGFEALNIDATVKRLSMWNMKWQPSATVTIAGQKLVLGSPKSPSSAVLRQFALYDEDANADDSMITGSALGGEVVTVANGATYDLGTSTMAGFLHIVSDTGEVAIFALNGANGSTAEVFDGQGVHSITKDTGTSTNVYWDAGGSPAGRYRLQNNQGAARDYRLTFSGSYSSF